MPTMTVGELAGVSGVTVRTLHHYDEIGLLVPSLRSAAGYRIYTSGDVDRLQAILTYRELGLGLEEIAAAVDSPEATGDVLRTARRRIDERIDKLNAIARSLDTAIAQEGKESTMTPEDKLSVFGTLTRPSTRRRRISVGAVPMRTLSRCGEPPATRSRIGKKSKQRPPTSTRDLPRFNEEERPQTRLRRS